MSKSKVGLKKGYFQLITVKKFSESEKRTIIEDYLQSGESKRFIWEKYTGQETEHGRILNWMRKLGYSPTSQKEKVIFAQKNNLIMRKQKKQEDIQTNFEYLQLQRRISNLERQLQESEMKCAAYQTMIEVAEREFEIPIKKKYNMKPSKR